VTLEDRARLIRSVQSDDRPAMGFDEGLADA
jgi:hypothetical protein